MKGKILLLIWILVLSQLVADDGWSSYEDKTYKVAFKYPSEWVRDKENEEYFGDWDWIVAFKSNVLGKEYLERVDVRILEGVVVSESDIPDFLDGFKRGIKDGMSNFAVSVTFLSQSEMKGKNENGYKLEFNVNMSIITIRNIYLLFFRDNGIYEIWFSFDESKMSTYERIVKKIISSFEFYKEESEIDTIFQTAKNNFDSEKWDMALKYFEEAKFHYERINSTQLVKTCEEWIAKIQKIIEAQELMKKAEELFDETKYDESKDMYKKARDIYIETGMAKFVQKIEEKIAQVNAKIEEVRREMEMKRIREEAESIVSEARSLFDNKKYDEAKAKFKEAKVKFESIQDSEKVRECEDWIKKSEEAGVTIIPALVVLLMVFFMLRKRH